MDASDLQSLCRDWPGVATSVKWEDDLVFTVAGKMFAVFCLRGPHRERTSFKVDPGRFLELTDQPGISAAAYMARAFWVSIAEPDRFARAKLSEFVRHSYDLVFAGLSLKQQRALTGVVAETAPATTAKPPAAEPAVAGNASKESAAKSAAAKPASAKKAAKKKPGGATRGADPGKASAARKTTR